MDLKLCKCALTMVLVVLGIGCGSNGVKYPPSQLPDGGTDATVSDARRPSDGFRADGSIGGDGGIIVKGPPISAPGAQRIVGEAAFLLIDGPSCTHEEGATGDRWCGFFMESRTSLGMFDLFVINMTKAAQGTPINCHAATVDPNCLRLTGGAAGGEAAPALFTGDTLIYHDLTGTPYGWRPGLLNGKPLTPGDAQGLVRSCIAAPAGTTVSCLRDAVPDDPASTTQSVDLFVGDLARKDEPILRRVDRVISVSDGDSSLNPAFRRALSPSGKFIAWSARPMPGALETLKVQRVGDDASRTTVATDVSSWQISSDETRWFWLSRFNYGGTDGLPRGTLQTAAFPAGGGVATLLPDLPVTQYAISAFGQVAALASFSVGGATLFGIPDPAGAPTAVTTLDTGSRGIVRVSRQGHVLYVKRYDGFVFSDLHITKIKGSSMPCILDSREQVIPQGVFLPSGGAVVWTRAVDLRVPIDEVEGQTMYTAIDDCKNEVVGKNIATLATAGDEGVVYIDDADEADGTLRFRGLGPSSMLVAGAPTQVQTRAGLGFEVLSSLNVVMYSVIAGSPQDGLYIYNYKTAPPTPGDAGARD